MGLSRALGMNLKRDAFSEQNLKSREHINILKEKLIFLFYRKIFDENKDLTPFVPNSQVSDTDSNLNELDDTDNTTPKSKRTSISLNKEPSEQIIPVSNTVSNVVMTYPHPQVNYKYFIGKGNNSIMVRSLFKNRYWWVQNDSENCNYVWTQNKVQRVMDMLPCKYPNKKSGLRSNGAGKKQNAQLLQIPQNK